MSVAEKYNERMQKDHRPLLGEDEMAMVDKADLVPIDFSVLMDSDIEKIDEFIFSERKKAKLAIVGEGDRFKLWCKRKGRELPSDEIVSLMNDDPKSARIAIRGDSEHPAVYRSLMTFMAMGGASRV